MFFVFFGLGYIVLVAGIIQFFRVLHERDEQMQEVFPTRFPRDKTTPHKTPAHPRIATSRSYPRIVGAH
jgi:hypothetical protein